jgi:hypothetical protein
VAGRYPGPHWEPMGCPWSVAGVGYRARVAMLARTRRSRGRDSWAVRRHRSLSMNGCARGISRRPHRCSCLPTRLKGVLVVRRASTSTALKFSDQRVNENGWRRVGSNHRQHDYESCALPLSYAAGSDLSACRAPLPCRCASWRGAWPALRASACSVQVSLLCRRLWTRTPDGLPPRLGLGWLRGSDSNRRPSGYEPDELPLLHPAPTVYLGPRGGRRGRRRRTTSARQARQRCLGAAVADGRGGGGSGEPQAVGLLGARQPGLRASGRSASASPRPGARRRPGRPLHRPRRPRSGTGRPPRPAD